MNFCNNYYEIKIKYNKIVSNIDVSTKNCIEKKYIITPSYEILKSQQSITKKLYTKKYY